MNFASAQSSPDKGKLSAIGNKIDPEVKAYIDASREEAKQADVAKAQQANLDLTFKEFPELNPDSEDFDRDFYNAAVEIEIEAASNTSLNLFMRSIWCLDMIPFCEDWLS